MIKRIFQQVANSKRLLAISIIFGCLGGIVLITEAYYIASIVDDVFMKGLGLAEVKLMLSILLAVIVVRGIVQMASEYMASKLAQQIKGELRLRLIDKLGRLGPQYSKSEQSGELASTVYEGVEQLEHYLAKYVPQIALSMFIPFAVFVVVLGQDLLSAFVYGVTLPLLILFMILIGKYTKHRTDKQYKLLGRLGGHFQEVLRGMETLKMFNRSKDQYSNIAKISEEHRISTMATLRLAFLSAFVMELFATISTAIVAVFLGVRLIEGDMNFFHAFLILLLTPEFYAPIRALGTQFHSGMNGASAATRIFQILDADEQGVSEQTHSVEWADGCKHKSGISITLNKVSLQFNTNPSAVLKDVSFTLEKGQKLALVGSTGAGKSTILELLQGFLKPSEGQVLINGVNLNDYSMNSWREQLAVVSQHAFLFHGTIKENLVGLDAKKRSDNEVWEALEWSGAKPFVEALPKGIHTVLTDQIQLSGGQIQRLALSRAYLRQDAQLVLLDEATNGLDIYHEKLVKSHLQHYLKNKTAIIVTHQLEVIEDADAVIVLNEGRIVQHGTPAKLAKEEGLFSRMLKANRWKQALSPANQESSSRLAASYSEEKREQTTTIKEATEANANASYDKLNKAMPTHYNRTSLSLKTILQSYRRLLLFFMKHKLLVLLAVLLSFFTIAANIGLMGTSGYLIAKSALRPENILMVYIPVIGVRFFGISRAVFRYLERLASHNVTFKTLHDLRLWLYNKIEPRGMTLLKDHRGGSILGAVISNIEQLQFFFLRIFSPVLVYTLVVVGSVAFMAFIHPALSVALLTMLLIAGIFIPLSSYLNSKRSGEKAVGLRATLYEQTLDMLRGVGTLQQFGWFKQVKHHMTSTQKELNAVQLKDHWHSAYHNSLMTIATQLGMWVLLTISIPLIREGSIAPYMLPAILLIALASFEGAAPLPQAFQSSLPVALSAQQLFQLADQKQFEHAGTSKMAEQDKQYHNGLQQQTTTEQPWHCSLYDVSFKYEGCEAYALKHIDLQLAKGKKVAVVGESGAGKSSLIQVLMQLRPLTAGSYSINGQTTTNMGEEAVREHFSVVSQQVQLFNATILDNLKLGHKQASLEKVREAARLAEIDEYIMSLPNGYYTMIGEYGATLSGGQRQRLALARAIIQGHAALLFDEPATGLDRLTEQAFLRNLKRIEKHHAVLWITHRLAQVIDMDEIIVLQQGKIVERGTHVQLLALKGSYWTMWCLERAQDYQSVV